MTRLAHTRPLRPLLILACACALAGALPPAAEAQGLVNDNYASPLQLNAPGSVLPGTSSRPMDTIAGATTELGENTSCERTGFTPVGYDSTVWYDIFPHRPGALRLTAESASFGAVVGVMPYDRTTQAPDINAFRCAVASLGAAILDYPFRLQEGAAYRIQVGGFEGTQGLFSLNAYFDPDTDRDGVLDSGDRCPAYGGGPETGGCPDSDGDGRFDPSDACPRESTRGKRDRNDNGCPDRELLQPETKLTAGSYCTGSICHGIRVKKLVISQIPRGTRVSVSCTKHGCKKASKRAGKRRSVRFFSGKALKAGVGLTIALKRDGFVGRRVTYWIAANDYKKSKVDCLKSGRPVKCTTALLVR
ncbi:MAG: OmpA-OmpF porin, family [Thermoleophilaceae bacterium]|nr:OmpA-OmpF porin, family [Thermoleophilaceae bacterium]